LISVVIEGIGIVGPGLRGWLAARAILTGEAPNVPAAIEVEASRLLPPSERRRAGVPVKLALAVAEEAFAAAQRAPAVTPTVFTSSSGDGDTVHHIFETLASEAREISPTRFHNSVHNAAAGYWSIATQSREPSTSVCGHDYSFAAGLLETATQIAAEHEVAALVAYDQPYPEPLHSKRPLIGSFAAALVMSRHVSARALARVEMKLCTGGPGHTQMADPALERLRSGIPAARCLPLLEAIARRSAATVCLEYGSTALELSVAPCC
jgi:hypothetical protein